MSVSHLLQTLSHWNSLYTLSPCENTAVGYRSALLEFSKVAHVERQRVQATRHELKSKKQSSKPTKDEDSDGDEDSLIPVDPKQSKAKPKAKPKPKKK